MIAIGTITKYGRYEGELSKVNRELKWSDFKIGVRQLQIVVEFEFYAEKIFFFRRLIMNKMTKF